MALTEDQQARFQSWAVGRGITHTCPACGIPELSLNDEMFTLPVHAGDPEFYGPVETDTSQMPVVQVVCDNCAHVMLFAAGRIGMVQRGLVMSAPGE